MRELTQNEIEQVSGSGFFWGIKFAILGGLAAAAVAAVAAVVVGGAIALFKGHHGSKPGPCGCDVKK